MLMSTTNQAPVLTTADGNGIVRLDFGAFKVIIPAVVLQADGKIVVSTYAWDAFSSADYSELIRYNADGSLDTAFGTDGVIPSTSDAPLTTIMEAGVALQADGKIVVSGDHFALNRYNSDGSLDTSFGTGGKVSGFPGGTSFAYGVVIEPDGKIVATGDNSNFGLARFDSNGNLDLSFGVGGKATASFGSSVSLQAHSLAGQPDGKLVVAGSADNGGQYDFALVRYNTDGSLDATFGAGGKVTTDFASGDDEAFSVTLQADGKIVAAGTGGTTPSSTQNIVLARYDSDGSLDASFGAGGKVTTDVGFVEQAESVKIQSDGKIVVAGYSLVSPANKFEFVLLRYNSDGSLDSSFGSGGKVTSDLGSPKNEAYSLVIQPDGKIVVVGTAGPNGAGPPDLALVRYNSDGSLDTSFGNGAGLNGPAFFIEDGSPAVLNAGATVHDADLDAAGSYAGASLTLARHGGADAQDVFGASGNLAALNEGGHIVLSGVTIGTVTHDSAGMLSLTFDASATEARVNEVMREITYFNTSDIPAALAQVDWSFSDGNTGAQGSGGALAATGSTTVHITAVDDAPVNTVPTAFDTPSNTDHAITGLSVSDPDSASLMMTLSVNHGTLTVAAIGGVSVNGSGSSLVSLTGSTAQIDAALAAANNVLYHSTRGFQGADVLTVDSSNGPGAGPFDTDTVAINVTAKHVGFDFNGDDFSDILWRDNATGDTGYSDVHNNAFHSLGGSSNTYSIAGVGDFNADNFSDILWRNNSTGDTGYSDLHNGAFHSLGGSSSTYSIAGVGDFNGDSFSDILWRNNSTGDTGYSDLHNNAFHSLGGSPTSYSVAGVGDFNDDGFSDLLWRNNSTGDTGYSDIHNVAFHSLGGSPTAYSVVGAGDFNGDGFSDVLWRNNSTGDTGYSDVHNGAFQSFGGSPTAYSVAGVADYNGDSFSDVLWRDNSTGDTGYSDLHNGVFHSLAGAPAEYMVMA
jgi:uncharacterized delta-60 repeat protein